MITLPCPVCEERLEIPEEISRFACARCNSELEVRRGGGIVSLAKITASPEGELALLEKELAALMQQRIVDAPVYMLLRHDLYRLGKLHIWNLTFASQSDLEFIFVNLKSAELDKIIANYQDNPQSQMFQWLLKIRECRQKIAQVKQSIRS